MKKLIMILMAIMLLATLVNADEMDLFYNFMQTQGITGQTADEIFESMPTEEQIVVLSILCAREDDDLDSLPPLFTQYEEIVSQNPSAVNLVSKLKGELSRAANRNDEYHTGAKWYNEGDKVHIRFDRGRRVDYIEVRCSDNNRDSRLKLVVDGYTMGTKGIFGYNTDTIKFDVNRTVNTDLFLVVREAPAYIYNIYVKYDDYYNNNNTPSYDYEYGFDFLKSIRVNGNTEYIDINKTISEFKLKVIEGDVYITRITMNTNGRDYQLDVNRTYYAGDYYTHELYRAMYVNYLRVEWNTYNYRTDVSIFVKNESSYNPNPTPGYEPIPTYINVSHTQVSSSYQANSTYSGYQKVSNSSALGQKVAEELRDDLRNGTISSKDREALRALTRGNFVIRKVSSNRFRVIWW
ncbi:MAG: hypothetical protein C0601_00625 [Candidatus Muiribacterium halophilum]|uniref:Uncharacterized protein n=1 Tax=Muiribacterium halophilum TaxID=2053465 RepID=A0A2N5ZMR0_MUIH1|nr:MAG: hypothetical protein C0601_00625 [Candidatus Muirbacterium halophilum]